jgi:phosphatidate phosphatase APP1
MIVPFPTYARRIADGRRWRVTVAGMVVRPLPPRSRRRTVALAVLRRLLDLDESQLDSDVFRRRAEAFLFQRVAGQRVRVSIGGRPFDAGHSDRIGHFQGQIDLDDDAVEALSPRAAPGCRWLSFEASPDDPHAVDAGDGGPPTSPVGGCVQLIEGQGVSVISDIDDTVKVTNVANRRELLANTFVREFHAVPGMVEVFRRWESAGVPFHYVSASPWQLAACLHGFFAESGLPTGSLHLKVFRLKDSTPLGRLPSRKRSKRRAIEQILVDFPDRRFLLVGDSGERDPEVYAAIARRHPRRISGIVIRQVDAKAAREKVRSRLDRLARRLPEGVLRVFTTADDLGGIAP